MPSLKALRNRIGSVKNTQKITRAMKLVAAARLRRAQDTITAARPYAKGIEEVIADVAARAGGDAHPLLERRPQKKVELLVLSADRGLAGAFNTNINRAAERFLVERADQHETISLNVVGRKARDYLRRRKHNVVKDFAAPTSASALAQAREIAHALVERYRDKQIDGVYLVYNEFKSAVTQTVRMVQLLPVAPKKLGSGSAGDFTYEPTREVVLDAILPQYVEIQIYRGMLESIASFFGAQMSAMDNASKNASEMIARLTLQYNRARQASITKELLEIIGGAEALKG